MIFDTNVHLTVSDCWKKRKNKGLEKDFYTIKEKFKLKGFACVAIGNLEEYDHSTFIEKFSNKGIHVVPALNLKKKILPQLKLFERYNCKTIKIHPRSFALKVDNINLEEIFYHCNKKKIKIFICTYFNDIPSNYYTSDPKYIFSKAYQKYPNLKIVLMHGGCERILEFAELIRFSKNILLDLSLTITKYAGSSLDRDIKFLFNKFDKKIVLGSDYPEVDYNFFIKRVKYFSKNITKDQKKNIYYRNIINFLKS